MKSTCLDQIQFLNIKKWTPGCTYFESNQQPERILVGVLLCSDLAEADGGVPPPIFWQIRKLWLQRRHAALLLATPDLKTFRHPCILLNMRAWVTSIISLQKKKVLRFAQYVTLPIHAHWVITIFEFSDCYLIDPAKKVFPKISENGLSEIYFNFNFGFLLSRKTQMTKNSILSQV